jgi:hypothetical protein
MIHSIPFAIFLDINPSSGCAVYNQAFSRYYQFFYYPILLGIRPISISSCFSFLAFRNVRRLVPRQMSIVCRRLDRELTAMILVRTATFIILVLPYVIHRIYWLQISIFQEESMRYAIDSVILVVIVSLLNLNFGVR